MDYVVYKTATGEIIRHGQCMPNDVALQAGEGESVLQETYQLGTVVNGVLTPATPDQVTASEVAYRTKVKAEYKARRALK